MIHKHKMPGSAVTIVTILAMIVIIIVVVFLQKNSHAEINEWSSSLTTEKVEWAQVAVGFGVEKRSHDLSTDEYGELISLLETVTEATSSRKAPNNLVKNDYYLAFRYDQKLWLFQCYGNEIISLTFEDADTSAYYGCKDSLLYIDSPALWEYIVNTVNSKAIE